MASTLERETARQPNGFRDAVDIPHRLLTSISGVAGLALAVLAGRDGSTLWRCGRVIGAAALTLGVLTALRRAGARWAGRTAIGFGTVAATVGTGFLPYLVKGGLSVTAAAGVLATTAGAALGVGGAVIASEHTHIARRAGAIFGTVLGMVMVAWVAAPAVAATNVPRPQIGATPASRGLAYASVVLMTSDGVRLAGWYVTSTNGAAVVLLHGAGSTRSSVLDQAVVLARHGFGVLLVDARGHGESSGRAMDFGWFGDRDIEAASRFLAERPEVRPDRIGVVGMSMGGEEAIGASGSNALIAAVVAEGATARSAADETWLSDVYGWRGAVQEQIERVQDVITDALTEASPPMSNRQAVQSSTDTRYLLIAAGEVADEHDAAAHVASAAPARVEVWTVPGSGHTEGLQTAPAEWEHRVIAFLAEALNVDTGES